MLSELPTEMQINIFTELPANCLLALSVVNKYYLKLTENENLWKEVSRRRWSDKLNYNLTPERDLYLSSFRLPWKYLYFMIEKEAKSTKLNTEILCNNIWSFRFLKEEDSDGIEYRVFSRDGKFYLSRIGTLYWQLEDSEDTSILLLDLFEPMIPKRLSDWGWEITNSFATLKSLDKEIHGSLTVDEMIELNRIKIQNSLADKQIIQPLFIQMFGQFGLLYNDNKKIDENFDILDTLMEWELSEFSDDEEYEDMMYE